MLIAYHGGVIQVKSYPCVFDYVYVYQLTADEHDADGEDLLGVGVGRDVAEAHAGEAAEGEVERRHVLVLDGGARAGDGGVVVLAQLVAERVQPSDGAAALHAADGVPDAGQPVGDQRERAHEQEEDRRSVLRVAVQLTRHTDQSQQTGRLQQANQGGCLGREAGRGGVRGGL